MDIFEVLYDSYRILAKYPEIILLSISSWVFVGIFALVLLAVLFAAGIGSAIINSSISGPVFYSVLWGAFLVALPFVLVGIVLLFAIGVFINGMYMDVGLQAFGGKVSLGHALNAAKNKFWSLIGLALMYGIITIFVIVLILIVIALAGAGSFGGLAVLGSAAKTTGASVGSIVLFFLALVILSIILLCAILLLVVFFYLGSALIMAEDLGAVQAFHKAISIGKAQFWSILGVIFFAAVVSWAIGFGIGIVGNVLSLIPKLGVVIQLLLTIALSILTQTWSGIMPAVYYKEYVGRKRFGAGTAKNYKKAAK